MTVTIPSGLRPVYSATPIRPPVALTSYEVRDLPIDRSDLPRGFGSQLASWQGGSR